MTTRSLISSNKKEDLIKAELNKPNLAIGEYLKQLEELYGDDLRKLISKQKDQLADLEPPTDNPASDPTE
jgi:hypothetical protein